MKKKGCAIGCVSLLVMIGGILALVMTLTKPVVDTANSFLTMLGDGKVTEAYNSTSEGLKADNTEAAFAQFVAGSRLDQYASSNWTNRSIENDLGRVEGTVTLKSGESYSAKILMVQEGDLWKVQEINVDPAAMKEVPANPDGPSTEAPAATVTP